MKYLFTLLIFFLVSNLTPLKAQQTSQSIQQYLTAIRNGQTASYPSLKGLSGAEQTNTYALLKSNTSDTLYKVRQQSYRLLNTLGHAGVDSALQTQIVTTLTQGLQDQDAGIVTLVAANLHTYPQSAFTPESKAIITQLIPQRKSGYEDLVLVAGYLQLHELEPQIIQMLRTQSGDMDTQERWNSYLAMARMGEPRAIAYIVKKMRQFPMGDDLVYELCPGMAYARQPETFAFLQEAIFSDEAHCSSADPASSEKITCAYRILEIVTPYIQDFPLQLAPGGDLDTDDYAAALKEARTWFQNHPDYQLKKAIF